MIPNHWRLRLSKAGLPVLALVLKTGETTLCFVSVGDPVVVVVVVAVAFPTLLSAVPPSATGPVLVPVLAAPIPNGKGDDLPLAGLLLLSRFCFFCSFSLSFSRCFSAFSLSFSLSLSPPLSFPLSFPLSCADSSDASPCPPPLCLNSPMASDTASCAKWPPCT